ncbi:MAG: hypothetical protein C0522_13240 [Rhodocyclaceae bacterium]|nr:hypothetical protein [Rhodocyclaceae bacterium]
MRPAALDPGTQAHPARHSRFKRPAHLGSAGFAIGGTDAGRGGDGAGGGNGGGGCGGGVGGAGEGSAGFVTGATAF